MNEKGVRELSDSHLSMCKISLVALVTSLIEKLCRKRKKNSILTRGKLHHKIRFLINYNLH